MLPSRPTLSPDHGDETSDSKSDAASFDAIFGRLNAPTADLFSNGEDPRHDALCALRTRLVQFASGLSRTRDLEPAAWAGHPIGVEIGEMSKASLLRLAQAIVDYQVPAFIDSGAFGVFMRGIRGGACAPLDFDQILHAYDHLTALIADHNAAEEPYPAPLFVMPDVVGDQSASLALVLEHRRWISTACTFPRVAKPIIPIQRGPMPVAEVYRRIVSALGSDEFVVGIPSNAAAFSPQEFTGFLTESRPRAVHILGAFASSRVTPRLNQILDSGLAESIAVSADANPLRSIIIERGQGAAERHDTLVKKLGQKARREALVQYVRHKGGVSSLRSYLAETSPDTRAKVLGLLADYSDLPSDLISTRLALPQQSCSASAA